MQASFENDLDCFVFRVLSRLTARLRSGIVFLAFIFIKSLLDAKLIHLSYTEVLETLAL